jgi:hypothetical protein
MGPLKGVTRWAGRASSVLESKRTCSGFQSHSCSSWLLELFQLSMLVLFAGEKRKEEEHGGVRGVCGDEAMDEREERFGGS